MRSGGIVGFRTFPKHNNPPVTIVTAPFTQRGLDYCLQCNVDKSPLPHCLNIKQRRGGVAPPAKNRQYVF